MTAIRRSATSSTNLLAMMKFHWAEARINIKVDFNSH